MHLLLYCLGQAPGAEQMRRALDPILRHGRDNISYLYALDAFDWTIIPLYFTVLGLLALLGFYRIRLVDQFWRYRDIKPEPKRRFAAGELPRITVQLPLFNELYVVERLLECGDGARLPARPARHPGARRLDRRDGGDRRGGGRRRYAGAGSTSTTSTARPHAGTRRARSRTG